MFRSVWIVLIEIWQLRIYTHVMDNMAQKFINKLYVFDKDFKNNGNQNQKLRLVQ